MTPLVCLHRRTASHPSTAAMLFKVRGNSKIYGPLPIASQAATINREQQNFIFVNYDIWPVIRYRPSWGIWVIGASCTRQCRHVWAIGGGLPSDRHIASARRGIYSVRRGITRSIDDVYLHVSSFEGAQSGEAVSYTHLTLPTKRIV